MQSDIDMPSDTPQLEVTAPVTNCPDDNAVDSTNNAGTDDMQAPREKPTVTETSEEMSSVVESSDSPLPIPLTKETVCKSPVDGAVAGTFRSHNSASQEDCLYSVKWIHFNGSSVGIITQNENGPCPLLAIVNILTLQGKIKLPATLQVVSSTQLMEYLADCVFEQSPPEVMSKPV